MEEGVVLELDEPQVNPQHEGFGIGADAEFGVKDGAQTLGSVISVTLEDGDFQPTLVGRKGIGLEGKA